MIIIRIIKYAAYSMSWYFFYNKIKKSDYQHIFDGYNIKLMALSIRDIFKFLSDLTTDNLNENSWLNSLTLPFNLSFKILFDSNSKKLFLFGFGFTVIVYRWLKLFRKILLFPFKLGIFSFVYSIFGFDVNWFLSWFKFFSLNIPYWVYIYYLTLYNNWLTWWYQNVNIKSITSVPNKEIKEIKKIKK